MQLPGPHRSWIKSGTMPVRTAPTLPAAAQKKGPVVADRALEVLGEDA